MCLRLIILHAANRYDLHALELGIWWVVVIDVKNPEDCFQLSVDKTTWLSSPWKPSASNTDCILNTVNKR